MTFKTGHLSLKFIILFCLSLLFVSPVYAVKYDKLNASALYERAVKYIDREDYIKANKALKAYTKSEPNDADGWNLYAFANRKMNKFEKAEVYYEKALNIDPDHKGALEYQGELFIQTNRQNLAEENLNKLISLCPNSCYELEKLQEYILNNK
jgi:tetratricopeptide (TPR) repeat protein